MEMSEVKLYLEATIKETLDLRAKEDSDKKRARILFFYDGQYDALIRLLTLINLDKENVRNKC